MVKGQTNRVMKLNREARNKPLHIWPNDFQQRFQDHAIGKRQYFQQTVLGKLEIHMQKDEVGPFPYSI